MKPECLFYGFENVRSKSGHQPQQQSAAAAAAAA
jgi:hypothetical protein